MANTTSDKLAYLSGTRDTLKTNLIAKGMDATSEATFRGMAEMVAQIQTGVKMCNVTIGAGLYYIYAGTGDMVSTSTASGTTIQVPERSFILCTGTSWTGGITRPWAMQVTDGSTGKRHYFFAVNGDGTIRG